MSAKFRSDEFPDTFLPGVARAADRALREVLHPEDAALLDALEVPAGLRPKAKRGR